MCIWIKYNTTMNSNANEGEVRNEKLPIQEQPDHSSYAMPANNSSSTTLGTTICSGHNNLISVDHGVWNQSIFILSLISVTFCGIFGIIATSMSILAYVDHKFNDVANVISRQKIAKVFMICAFLAGISVVIIVITVNVVRVVYEVKKD